MIPKLVDRATNEATEVVVFLSDIHAPFHDAKAIDSVEAYLRDVQPHRVVLNGDITDFYALSSFDKDVQRKESLGDEIQASNDIRRRIREAVPNAVIDENEGNHEARLISYLNKNRTVFAPIMSVASVAEKLTIGSLHNHDELEINAHGDEGFLLRENFWVKHGEFVRADAGMSAKAQMLRGFINGVSGHTHRLAEFPFRAQTGQRFVWLEQGCLCDLDCEYLKGGAANWDQGFVVGHFSTASSAFQVEIVRIQEGSIVKGIA